MQFEWDENKNLSNQEKHGVDFNQAIEVWNDENKLEIPDNRKDYGEERWIIIGKIVDITGVVVYTVRRTSHRIISARRANRKEREIYTNQIKS